MQREVNKVMEEPIREVRKLVDEPVADFKKAVSDKPVSPRIPDVPPAVGP
jgi:hypothetical protein